MICRDLVRQTCDVCRDAEGTEIPAHVQHAGVPLDTLFLDQVHKGEAAFMISRLSTRTIETSTGGEFALHGPGHLPGFTHTCSVIVTREQGDLRWTRYSGTFH